MPDARSEARSWVDAVPMRRHRRLLHRVLDFAEREPRVRFVELCCSVARGAGDEHSDLDLGIGIRDDAWSDTLDALRGGVMEMGTVVDMLEHEMGSWRGIDHRRFLVHYADLPQLDLVAMLASRRTGLPPGSVALYDPDGRLGQVVTPQQARASAADVREWAFEAYVGLLNVDKYLRRGSAWEALEQLHQVRTYAWQLWAAAHGVSYPGFGVTAVLDADGLEPPPGLEASVPGLTEPELRAAGSRLVEILGEVAPSASARTNAEHPGELGALVARRWNEPADS